LSTLGMIPYLVESIQELSEEISALKQRGMDTEVVEEVLTVDVAEASNDLNVESITATDLNVIGNTLLAETTITGGLNIGMIQIDPTENSIDAVGTLKIQPLALGEIEMMGGLVRIDTEGNVAAETVAAKQYKVAGASLGTSTLPAGEMKVFVETEMARETAKIFTGPRTKTGNQMLIIESVEDGRGFTVAMENPIENDIDFDWWIVEKI
jgi:hypothetical protein